jgi:hypothetical protein
MKERWNSLKPDTRLALKLLTGATIILVIGFAAMALVRPAPRLVTMDSGGQVETINLWGDYTARDSVTGRVEDGTLVRLMQQSGDGCLVEVNSVTRGWVTCNLFIREFR